MDFEKKSLDITKFSAQDLPAISRFIAGLNQQPQHHIVYFGTTPEEVAHYLVEEQTIPVEESYLKACYCGKLVGIIGLEYDLELKRAWIEGPLVTGEYWNEIAAELYAAILELIPSSINDYELACDTRNAKLKNFAEDRGYTHNGDSALLIFYRTSLSELPVLSQTQLGDEFIEQFQILHDCTFPGTYYNGRQLVEKIDRHHKIFTVVKDCVLLGYIYAGVSPSIGDAYIDFIGVREDSRRQGTGRRLLVSALHWIFSFPQVNQVGLMVRVENQAAIKMYQNTGFNYERTLRGYRKKFPSAD